MKAYLLPGVCGLFLGLTLRWTGFHRPEGLQDALALRRSDALRSGLYALGLSIALTALLCWLAVIDVDEIEVLPLNAGVIAGGVLFGTAAGLCGFTPGTAFAGLGGGPALTALCVLAGCTAGAAALPLLAEPFAALRAMGPVSATTLFEVTLDEPFLLDGGFLGQGCAGLLLMVIAGCIPSPRPEPEALPDSTPVLLLPAPEEAAPEVLPEGTSGEEATEDGAKEAPSDEAADPEAPDVPDAPDTIPADASAPEDAPAETFVAILPGEEPLIVDTSAEESDPETCPKPTPDHVSGEDSGEKAPEDSEATSDEGCPEDGNVI